jgi:heme exporter protein A
MTLLAFDQVALVRGGRLLFDGLDLRLEEGGGLHLVGPNGVGKSTLIRLAAGLLKESAGKVQRSELALADDQLALDRELPLAKALAFWGAQAGMDAMGLAPLAHVPVRMLSTGQAKRATLARVAASGAPLWLLDEPLNGLDQDGLDRLDALIEQHRRNGGGVLAASHRPMRGNWTELRLGG